jgi:hypothetical protein
MPHISESMTSLIRVESSMRSAGNDLLEQAVEADSVLRIFGKVCATVRNALKEYGTHPG